MEDALIIRAQQGDASAFHALMERYSDVVWRTARVLLRDPVAAEDAAQEAWIDVWRGLPSFRGGRPFRPWLLAVVANRCHMLTRRRQLTLVPLMPEHTEEMGGGDDTTEPALRHEADAELACAVAKLPPEQQRVLELRYFAELEVEEIALLVGAPAGTVKSRLHRALRALRERMRDGMPALSDGEAC